MKKLFILLLLSTISIHMFSQLTIEESYSHSGTMIEIEDNVFKYFMMDVPLNQCAIYNEDHTPYKTIDLTIPEGYYLYDIKFVSTHLFNSDDDIELLYIYSKYELINEEYIPVYGMKVTDESGTPLMSLSNGAFAEIKEGSDGPRLLAYQYIWNDTYYLINTKVYAMGGSASAAERYISENLLAYPNPASEFIHVNLPTANPKEIFINDLNGRMLLNETPSEAATEVSINTSQLQPGIYTISVLGEDGSIITEKFEKQ